MHKLSAFTPMSSQAFAALGMQDVAYMKPVQRDGRTVILVHAADGTEMGVMESRDIAIAALRQNGIEPLSAH
jgi:hypothetical protein